MDSAMALCGRRANPPEQAVVRKVRTQLKSGVYGTAQNRGLLAQSGGGARWPPEWCGEPAAVRSRVGSPGKWQVTLAPVLARELQLPLVVKDVRRVMSIVARVTGSADPTGLSAAG